MNQCTIRPLPVSPREHRFHRPRKRPFAWGGLRRAALSLKLLVMSFLRVAGVATDMTFVGQRGHVVFVVGISLRMLQRHLTSIYRKTGARSRVGLTRAAERGFAPSRDQD